MLARMPRLLCAVKRGALAEPCDAFRRLVMALRAYFETPAFRHVRIIIGTIRLMYDGRR